MTALLTRALPLLNKLVPAGLAVKGLSKIDGRLASFISNSVGAGYAAENIVDYLRERMSPEGDKMEENRLNQVESQGNLTSQERVIQAKRKQESGLGKAIGAGVGLATGLGGLGSMGAGQAQSQSQQPQAQAPRASAQPPPPPPQNANLIQQYSDNLNQYLTDLMSQGNSPAQAAMKAKKFLDPKQLKIIKRIEDENQADWKSIVEAVFGTEEMPSRPPSAEYQAFTGPASQTQQGQQPQGQGQGAQALMQMVQQINQRLGKK